jgi:hypothetical protein
LIIRAHPAAWTVDSVQILPLPDFELTEHAEDQISWIKTRHFDGKKCIRQGDEDGLKTMEDRYKNWL